MTNSTTPEPAVEVAHEPARVLAAVEIPQHRGLAPALSYLHERPLPAGTLIRVPLGRRTVTGVVWLDDGATDSPDELKAVAEVLDAIPPLGRQWCEMAAFCATYYQRSIGEVALSVLPPELRKLDNQQLALRVRKLQRAAEKEAAVAAPETPPPLSPDQDAALARLRALAAQATPATALLHGVTGSGKTEVYLRAADDALTAGRQALILVPEINLTPQLEARFAARFAGRRIVALHSGLTPAQRLRAWLAAHLGQADLVLGTRLAIFASMPRLGLIVVDEEHDPSYKQQEGARYSARDLAVYRGRLAGATVLLGSATPSLESWQRASQQRYTLLPMPARIGDGALPQVRIADMSRVKPHDGGSAVLAPAVLDALRERLARGEQSLVFLNRRGYAPVLNCADCGWKSACPHCSAWRVFHKLDRQLRCHHCGLSEPVPRACPECGNLDISAIGRGTERLAEQLGSLLQHADGRPARILRIDADSTRHKGALEARLGEMHAGEVDVLVGTQMVTKGHDFRRVTLVAAVNPDSALFSSDFRGPERLFALLMQAAGRAGRDHGRAAASEMWIQTWNPRHPLYAALTRHDYAAFASTQLGEREMAGLPPYSHLAMLRADARTVEAAQRFLEAAAALGHSLDVAGALQIYPPVPPVVSRVADVERMQMLVESASRAHLQQFLARWVPALHELRTSGTGRVLRWAIDVDPLTI